MNLVTFLTRYLFVFLTAVFWAGLAANAQQAVPTPATSAPELPTLSVSAPKPDTVGELPAADALRGAPGASAP